jgi:hypothetical protein
MVVNMKVVGKMVNSMDSVLTLLLVAKPNKVNGLTVKDFSGSTIMKQISDCKECSFNKRFLEIDKIKITLSYE